MPSVRFRKIIIAQNARSTQAEDNQKYTASIRESCPGVEFVSISFNNKLAAKLANSLESSSLVCISGGDGTVNAVVQTLLESPLLSADQRQTPILPLWGGNANDIAHMLNGRASAAKCKTILEQGAVVPIYPLRCELRVPSGKKPVVRVAIGYLSFGVSARAAQRLNEISFRANPLHTVPGIKPLNEVLLLLHAMQSSQSFIVEQNGKQKIVYDWIIGKGPRMAKNIKLPVELTDRSYYQSVVRKNLPEVALRLGGMAWGTLEPSADTEPITFTTQQPIWAQFDGEPMQLAAGTKITVRLNNTSFYALSTQLQEPATLKT